MTSPVEQRYERLMAMLKGFVFENDKQDGSFVAAPEWPSKETSAEAILERAGAKRLSPDEFDQQFGHLPTDGEWWRH
jgi:hypothetical protein